MSIDQPTGSGTVTSIVAGTGLAGGTITSTGTIGLSVTGVTAGNYTLADITVDAEGRITAAADGSGGSGTVTSLVAGTGLSGGTITSTGTISMPATGVSAGSYALADITVDAEGRLTAANNGSAVTSIVAGTGLSGGTITSTGTISLPTTGVSAGSYTSTNLTVDAEGRITAASNGSGGGTHGATIQAGPLFPTLPSSTSNRMQGLGSSWKITPVRSGNVLVNISGYIISTGGTVAGDGVTYGISYGTGTAPANNAAQTGTSVGGFQTYSNPNAVTAADVAAPFSLSAVITGLTLSTAYWFDLVAALLVASTSYGFSVASVNIVELP